MSIAEQLTMQRLSKCKHYKKAISNIERDIKTIEEELYNLRGINFDTIKARGKGTYKVEEMIQEKKDLETILNSNKVRLSNIELTIRQLKDKETVEILTELYINDLQNISVLEDKLHLSRSTIYRKRDKGLEDLSEIMWGAI